MRFVVVAASLACVAAAEAHARLDEQVAAVHPLVYVVPDFASPSERAAVLERMERCHDKQWAECKEQRSNLHVKKARSDGNTSRPLRNSTSFTLTLDGEIHEAFDVLVKRGHALARHPITHGEGVQIASYFPGDYYGFHHDSLMRRATLLLYLTDIPEGDGGETIFPLVRAPGVPEGTPPPLPPAVTGRRRENLDFKVEKMEEMAPYCDSDYYLKVRPEAGKALLFYSYGPNFALDEFAIHGACPLKRGHKAIFQRWMRFEENSLYGKAEEAVRKIRSDWGRGRLLQPAESPEETTTNIYAEISARMRKTRRRTSESLNVSETVSPSSEGASPGTPAEL